MDPYKGLHNVSNCIHTESFYTMGFVTFVSPCIFGEETWMDETAWEAQEWTGGQYESIILNKQIIVGVWMFSCSWTFRYQGSSPAVRENFSRGSLLHGVSLIVNVYDETNRW
jgi:hypothetical protein